MQEGALDEFDDYVEEPHAPRALPALREGLRWFQRRPRLTGWIASLVITGISFILRVWHLGIPHVFEFDETYYAKDAWSLLHHGFAENWSSNANALILKGEPSGLVLGTPEMIVHPEVGKWLIGLGELVWGFDPTGWRVAPLLAGTLLVLLMIRMTLRLTGSLVLACAAGILLCSDGLEFVLSRLALLDIFVALFTLAGVYAVILDRHWFRDRLAAGLRPRFFRPWLLVAGLAWGLACASKWDAAWPFAVFCVMSVLWSAGARYVHRLSRSRIGSLGQALARDAVPAFIQLVLVALVVYVVSWSGWLANHATYEQNLSSTQYTQFTGTGHCDGQTYVADDPDTKAKWPSADGTVHHGLAGVEQAFESLWHYHRDVLVFHDHFLNCATHTYASNPIGWLILNRSVGVAVQNGIQPGQQGCAAPSGDTCLRQVLLLGTPVLWWGGCLATIAALLLWVGTRDWRFGIPVLGVASVWLPWLPHAGRPIFSFYMVSAIPFMVLALVLCFGKLIGHTRERSGTRTLITALIGLFVLAVVANFAFFWPIYTYRLLTHGQWLARMWFSRWI